MGRKVADAPRDYKRGLGVSRVERLAAAGSGLRETAQDGEQKHRDPGEQDGVHFSKPSRTPISLWTGEAMDGRQPLAPVVHYFYYPYYHRKDPIFAIYFSPG
jgi:hypothetical protein